MQRDHGHLVLPRPETRADQLIDIHSQHDSLLLTNADFRLNLVDNAADNHVLLADYQSVYHRFVGCRNELDRLRDMSQKNVKENDFLAFQLDELQKADLQEGEYEEDWATACLFCSR